MIVPSIDLIDGRAVQLRRGREFVLDGGDPFARLEEFSVAGEVAIVDLDAALGRGSNAGLIREMVRRAPCRVGGGIRAAGAALDWLDAGAARVVIGTAASPELLGSLPRDRVVTAVDASNGRVVVDGWRAETGADPVSRIAELAPVSGAFLLTQVEVEGMMQGFDRALVMKAAAAAALGGSRLTAAGGITTADDIAWLDQLGADAQVGMALYTGRMTLGDAVAAPLRKPPVHDLWPTIVRDESGQVLGLVWSTRESIAAAMAERRGVYWSRSRGQLWRKGEYSGAIQRLLRIDLDCDRDALQFTVHQEGPGFCHTGARSCFGGEDSLGALERTIRSRIETPKAESGTTALLRHPALLAAKLVEEARELGQAQDAENAEAEAADLIYFALTAVVARGGSLAGVTGELARRSSRVRRRPMTAKERV
jgi:phosphoribosyl-ATP pyrophosphohydrolase/phosphoribosyl-AMP cyclohydrolase